jgi:hypothetical protein
MRAIIFFTATYLVLCACLVAQTKSQPSNYDLAYAEWERASSVVAFRKLQDAWRGASQFERDHAAYYYARAAVTTAAQAPPEDAYLLLREVGMVASEHPIVISRGKSARRFQDVATVHAQVWAASKADPLAKVPVGYEMTAARNGFVAIQESAEVEPTMALGADAALASNEGLGLLLSFDSAGSILEELPVAIADGTGSIHSRLKAILVHEPAGPSGPSRFVRQEPETFFAAQTDTAPTAKSTSLVSSPSPKNGTKEPPAKPMPTTTSGEPTSSTPWSIIVVLIMAAIGLLWLVLRNRK